MSPYLDLLNEALTAQRQVSIRYQNKQGKISNLVIQPLRWETSDKLYAYCVETNKEMFFLLKSILACQPFSTNLVSGSAPSVIIEKSASLPVQRKRRSGRSSTSVGTALSQVKTSSQWRNFVQYFRTCLILEHRQMYQVKDNRRDIRFFDGERSEIHAFLRQDLLLTFDAAEKWDSESLAPFIRSMSNQKQLCLGYPTLVLSEGELAPLLYVPVNVKESDGKLLLEAEDLEVNYAAYSQFKLSNEQISDLVQQATAIQPAPGQLLTEAIEAFLVEAISDLLRNPLQRRRFKGGRPSRVEPLTLYDEPCLFWVAASGITAHLIEELDELALESVWSSTPEALKYLLQTVPPETYLPIVDRQRDTAIYVTPSNERQRQAAANALSRRLTVVTGPPGTGKSQMILNVIAQAVLNHQTVLFASRNNDAVDVVMDRLKHELGFRGAVRTGNKEMQNEAATDMLSALGLIGVPQSSRQDPVRLRDAWLALNQQVLESERLLEQVRDLNGLRKSHLSEREHLITQLPTKVAESVRNHPTTPSAQELYLLQETISIFVARALQVKNERQELADTVHTLFARDSARLSLLKALHEVEDQWGTFGGGILHPGRLEHLGDLTNFLETWVVLAPLLELHSRATDLMEQLYVRRDELVELLKTLPPVLSLAVEDLSVRLTTKQVQQETENWSTRLDVFRALSEGHAPWWRRFLNSLRFVRPAQKLAMELSTFEAQLEYRWERPPAPSMADAPALLKAGQEVLNLLRASDLQQQIRTISTELENVIQMRDAKANTLSEALQHDLVRLTLKQVESSELARVVTEFLAQAERLRSDRDALAIRINGKIDENDQQFRFLADFRDITAANDKRLWVLRVPASLDVILKHLLKWRKILLLWDTQASLRRIETELEGLPDEATANEVLRSQQAALYQNAVDLLQLQWLFAGKQLSSKVIQDARDFVSYLSGESKNYSRAHTLFASTLRLFPVWATTNLSARRNFPLVAQGFDLVIIDEASQCDIPSALPLLYRAKQILIIGDRNQLRHVSTLSAASDHEAAAQYGIALEAFQYSKTSLFDLAQRSTGTRPGTLLLEEHYRSDPRIIGFSNKEFYNSQLKIHTDLRGRQIPQRFIALGCGAYWLDVEGTARHPGRGSAMNQKEFSAIKELVPRLLDTLARYKMDTATIGIVTPFRPQADLIAQWVKQQYSESERIRVGTVHTFQGSERDIVIFSPVLAPGLTEGSLSWLEKHTNLLNVAITRARLSLIIVGNWKFCHSRTETSRYRHLADYIDHSLKARIATIDALPLFGGAPINIVGTLTDPSNSKHTRTTLRSFLASCSEFIWWMDVYFNNGIFSLLQDVLDETGSVITDIRILTTSERTIAEPGKKPELDLDLAVALQNDLRRKGISFEVRVMLKQNLKVHDRLLYSYENRINMPPFNGAVGQHKHVAEYTESKTEPSFFLTYWDKATPLLGAAPSPSVAGK